MTFLRFAPVNIMPAAFSFGAAANMLLDGTTKRLAYKFFARAGDPITHVDFYLSQTGSPTGVTLTAEIQTDASGVPSDTLVGTATAAFAPTGNSYQGAQALGSQADLTVNTPYWLVVRVAGATLLDATNFYQARQCGVGADANRERIRAYNGTNWTTVAEFAGPGLFVVMNTAAGHYQGFPILLAPANSAATDIFGNNRQAVRYKIGAPTTFDGIAIQMAKQGSPSNLEVLVYEGSTLLHTQAMDSTPFETNQEQVCHFDPPVEVAADTNIYFVFRQAADGGNDTNDYDVRVTTVQSDYVGVFLPPDVRFLSGTGDDPTAYTVDNSQVPAISPFVRNPATGLTSEGGSTPQPIIHSE